MRELKIKISGLTIYVPDDFGKWNNERQLELIEEKVNEHHLVVSRYNLTRPKASS